MTSPTLLIPLDVRNRVQAFVDAGQYASEADVVRAALDALEMQTSDLEAIQAGIDDMSAGRCRPFEEFAAEFENRNGIQ
jgi:Arc/MetJ-type ribon-helix-helix transcriptional regulator